MTCYLFYLTSVLPILPVLATNGEAGVARVHLSTQMKPNASSQPQKQQKKSTIGAQKWRVSKSYEIDAM